MLNPHRIKAIPGLEAPSKMSPAPNILEAPWGFSKKNLFLEFFFRVAGSKLSKIFWFSSKK